MSIDFDVIDDWVRESLERGDSLEDIDGTLRNLHIGQFVIAMLLLAAASVTAWFVVWGDGPMFLMLVVVSALILSFVLGTMADSTDAYIRMGRHFDLALERSASRGE